MIDRPQDTRAPARSPQGASRNSPWRVVAATALAIGLLGLAIAFGPGVYLRLADAVTSPHAAHAAQARQREIDRRFEQAVVMLHARRYDHAVAALHRLLELAPRMPEAHVNMGYALLGAGEPRAARDFFESATELRPQQANAYYGMAIALEALGDLPGAIGAMRTFVHLSPKEDTHVRKANAALWEWSERKSEPAAAGAPTTGK